MSRQPCATVAFFMILICTAAPADPITNQRLGIGLATQGNNRLEQFDYPRLHIAWYFDWSNGAVQGPIGHIQYVPLIGGWGFNNIPSQQTIRNWINNRPGRYPDGTLWTIGNEIGFDDSRTPQQYAVDYHTAYVNLKAVNPTFRVCNGAVFPIDTLHYDKWKSARVIDGRDYMTQVREAYQSLYGEEMPIDAWMIHGYSIADWYSLSRFEELVRAWRKWMAQIGHRDKPLLMKEFSPLPGGDITVVGNYLIDSHRILHTLFDPATGPACNHFLLAQRFSWFVNNDGEEQFENQWDDLSLFDSDSKQIRPLGEVFERMALWHVGSEDPQLDNGDIESATAGQAVSWKPWRASGDTNATAVPSTGAARSGQLGLRIAGKRAGAAFDGGASQFLPGLEPDRAYRVKGHARVNLALGSDRRILVGLDPTGQQANGTAATIVYSSVPAGRDIWVAFETEPVRAFRGAMSLWLRAATSRNETFICDLDDLEFVPTDERLANPYGVADISSTAFAALGLPEGTTAYDAWYLDAGHTVQVIHPSHRYVRAGRAVPMHAWDPASGSFIDAPAFAAWIASHPRMTWILGDQPDADAGDGLSPAQYGRMVAAAAGVILTNDPSAKLISAALAQEDNAAFALQWWQQARASYTTASGNTRWPFSVWGVRLVSAASLYAAEVAVEQGIPARKAWIAQLDSGAYAALPLWVTALGLHHGATESDRMAFMAAASPRLEYSPVERWFWLDGAGLTGSSELATRYAALAAGRPNVVPPPAPDPTATPRPQPPEQILEDFNDQVADGWVVRAGSWSAASRVYRVQQGTQCGDFSQLPHRFRDATVEFDLRLESAQQPTNWAGCVMHNPYSNTAFGAGYLVFLRQNGELGIFAGSLGQVVTIPNAVTDVATAHRFRIEYRGPRITVWIDGVEKATWTDAENRWPQGTFSFVACLASATFDNVQIVSPLTSVLDLR